jgi:Molybdopterin-binding domain of aldehyde dehydrogenase
VPNTSPTAASASSDMYGAAVADACRQIADRLEPFREAMPNASFKVLRHAQCVGLALISGRLGASCQPEIQQETLVSLWHTQQDIQTIWRP